MSIQSDMYKNGKSESDPAEGSSMGKNTPRVGSNTRSITEQDAQGTKRVPDHGFGVKGLSFKKVSTGY